MKRVLLMLMFSLVLVGCSDGNNEAAETNDTYKVVTLADKETNGLEEPYMTVVSLTASLGSYAKIEVDPSNKILIIQTKEDLQITSDDSAIEFFKAIESMATDEVFTDYKYAVLNSDYDLEANGHEFTEDDLTVIYQNGELIKSSTE